MTLNGVMALILLFSPNSIAKQADYVTLVKETNTVHKILSPSSSPPLLANTNAPCSAVFAIAEHLVFLLMSRFLI